MALTDESGMVMPVGPMYGNNNGGFGGFGNDSGWWIILLFILLGNRGGNWGNGGNDMQAGFNQAAITSALSALQTSVTSGFGDVQMALCNGFNQAEVAANARQMADMQQIFSLQQQFAQCCCENRAGIADLKYTISQENCADRQAVNDALVNVINQMNTGFQSIRDEFCNDRLARKDELIADLRQQLNERDRLASQNAQTAQIIANNEAQTVALERYLAPTATPAYIVPNPNCCGQNYGCVCGAVA